MPRKKNPDDDLIIAGEMQYTGTTKEIVTLSLAIAKANKTMDSSVFTLYKEKSNINSKIFSKLKIIGEKLLELTEAKRRDVIKGLPSSYNTIHALCSLAPEELVTAIKSKCVTQNTSYRGATAYVKQIKFPQLAAADGEKGRWSTKQEHLWSVFRTDDMPLEGEAKTNVEEALRRVCKEHGVVLRQARISSTSTLRKEERRELAAFWRRMLEKEVRQKWFQDVPNDLLKKQFNIRNVDELRDTPLRQFTGFLINASGGREIFWEKHGKAYVAKLQFLMESTEDAAQRYNYKRRLENVMAEKKELAVWNNVILKNSGFI